LEDDPITPKEVGLGYNLSLARGNVNDIAPSNRRPGSTSRPFRLLSLEKRISACLTALLKIALVLLLRGGGGGTVQKEQSILVMFTLT
jgi:hypothetical protein